MGDRTQKHWAFVTQPMGYKNVTELAGIGTVYGGRLQKNGYPLARNVLEKFLELKKNRDEFENWLYDICGANSRWSSHCYHCLSEWCMTNEEEMIMLSSKISQPVTVNASSKESVLISWESNSDSTRNKISTTPECYINIFGDIAASSSLDKKITTTISVELPVSSSLNPAETGSPRTEQEDIAAIPVLQEGDNDDDSTLPEQKLDLESLARRMVEGAAKLALFVREDTEKELKMAIQNQINIARTMQRLLNSKLQERSNIEIVSDDEERQIRRHDKVTKSCCIIL